MPLPDSPELAQVAAEAQDIAEQVGQRASTAHLLLAIFTVPSSADDLLRERRCDEDAVLAELARKGAAPEESAELFEAALERARDIAQGCSARSAEPIHLLLALTRLTKCAGSQLLEACAAPVSTLRTTAMSWATNGAPKRRAAREEVKVPAAPAARVATTMLPRPEPKSATTAIPTTVSSPSPSPATSTFTSTSTSTSTSTADRWALDPNEYPWLTAHARNLSQLAAQQKLDAAIGREHEVDELLDILGKRRANNPVLVGEPGVGKTAIVEGLALELVRTARPDERARLLVELDVGNLVAGTALRGSFSERLNGIKDEVRKAEGGIVVFIDELHMLIGAGAAGEGPQDASNELKAALARGEFPCIGATTHDEFRKHVQGDPALERRFVPVLVREPSLLDTERILRGAVARYEEHHAVRYAPDALAAAAELSARYVRDRFLPDKAFAAIDLAGSRARREGRSEVVRADVGRAVARMAGLPEERVLQPEGDRFLQLAERLQARIVGHGVELSKIADSIKRNFAGFRGRRPLASFLLLGPPGVGKTETARALADELYPGAGASSLLRIDLSEYAEPHSVSRLLGAPPGYVGYGEGGQLTDAVRRRPACVVLLDEVEKAHPAVLQTLLPILEEGCATDGRGRRVDFTSAVLVLTSNLGGGAFAPGGRAVGFGGAALDAGRRDSERALEAARSALPPELWSRLDERLVFAPLERPEVVRIAELLLADSSRRLWEERRIAFRSGPGLVELLIGAGGYEAQFGARPMRQIIQRLVESPLADAILAGRVQPGERLVLHAQGGAVELRPDE